MKEQTCNPRAFDHNYILSGDGRIWSNLSNRYLLAGNAQTSVNNYRMVTVCDNSGERHTMTLAKFKMLLWDFREDYEDLDVDHIDHNTHNDSLANLQWLTHKRNIQRKRKGYTREVANIVVEHLDEEWEGDRYEVFINGKGLSDYYIPGVTINALARSKQGKNWSKKWKIAVWKWTDEEVVEYLMNNGREAYKDINK